MLLQTDSSLVKVRMESAAGRVAIWRTLSKRATMGGAEMKFESEPDWERRAVMILGMCTCGRPEAAYNFLRKCLSCFDERQPKAVGGEDAIKELILTDPDTTAHVIAHLLSGRELTDHDVSVESSRLSPSGQQIVDSPEAIMSHDRAR